MHRWSDELDSFAPFAVKRFFYLGLLPDLALSPFS
jgi:hypothetical protein